MVHSEGREHAAREARSRSTGGHHAVTLWDARSLLPRPPDGQPPTLAAMLVAVGRTGTGSVAGAGPVVRHGELAGDPGRLRRQLREHGIVFVTEVPAFTQRELWQPVCDTLVR